MLALRVTQARHWRRAERFSVPCPVVQCMGSPSIRPVGSRRWSLVRTPEDSAEALQASRGANTTRGRNS